MKKDKIQNEKSQVTTAEKRAYIEKNFPATWDFINHNLNLKEYRLIDSEFQNIPDVWVLQYAITLLCDELTYLTNENLTVTVLPFVA